MENQEMENQETVRETLFIVQCSQSVSPFKDYNPSGPAKEHYLGHGMSRLKMNSAYNLAKQNGMTPTIFSCFEVGCFPMEGTVYDYTSSAVWLESLEMHKKYFDLKGAIYNGYRQLYNYIPASRIRKAWTFLSEHQTSLFELYYFEVDSESVWESKRPPIGVQYGILKSLSEGYVSELADYHIKPSFISELLRRVHVKGTFDKPYEIPKEFGVKIQTRGDLSPAMKASLPPRIQEYLRATYLNG